MQRWIAAGVVAMVLVLGGGGFAWWSYKQHKPWPVWVPLPINREVTDAKQAVMAKELFEKLGQNDVLLQVSKDLHLPGKLHVPTDAEAAAVLRQRLFVKVGEMDSPMGKAPSINVGVTGIARDKVVSGEIATRLVKEVWKILGIKPPPAKEF